MMTEVRKRNRILGILLAAFAVWAVIFSHPSYAAQRGSLNVKTEQDGMVIRIFRVAEKRDGGYVLNEEFQPSGADVKNGASRDAALILAGFVKAHGIEAYRTGTGTGKHVIFRNLPAGEALYLVTGEPLTIGEKTYIPVPVLVEAGEAAVEVDMKCEIEEPEEPTKPTEPSEPTKPSSPTEPSGPTEPESPTNPTSPSRRYDDSDDADWDPTPDKKPRTTTAANETVTITDAETQTETDVQETFSAVTGTTETEGGSEAATGRLPQTGQVWWPVGILGCVGAVLVLSGIVMRGRNKEEERIS